MTELDMLVVKYHPCDCYMSHDMKDLLGGDEISWNYVEFEVRYECLSEEINIGMLVVLMNYLYHLIMVYVWCVYGVCMVCVWCVYGVCMVCVWCVYGVCMVCVWCVLCVCLHLGG